MCDRGIDSHGLYSGIWEKYQLSGGNVACSDGGKSEREVRCQKRDLFAWIWELDREVSLCTDRQDVSLCWNKLKNLGKDMSKSYQLLSDNGDIAASAVVGDPVGFTYKSLRLKCQDRMNQMVEQLYFEVQPEDRESNVGTALSRSFASALTKLIRNSSKRNFKSMLKRLKRKSKHSCKRNCKPSKPNLN